jgi:hypothetical protein
MAVDTAVLSLGNRVFRTYLVAVGLMILKLMLQPWMTVARMRKVNAGFRRPKDAKKSPLKPKPDPKQLAVNEDVDRSRRLNLNDLESTPGFLAAGFLLVLVPPRLLVAQILNLDPCRLPGRPFRHLCHRSIARRTCLVLDLGLAVRARHGGLAGKGRVHPEPVRASTSARGASPATFAVDRPPASMTVTYAARARRPYKMSAVSIRLPTENTDGPS